jgi:hypothetical protein
MKVYALFKLTSYDLNTETYSTTDREWILGYSQLKDWKMGIKNQSLGSCIFLICKDWGYSGIKRRYGVN